MVLERNRVGGVPIMKILVALLCLFALSASAQTNYLPSNGVATWCWDGSVWAGCPPANGSGTGTVTSVNGSSTGSTLTASGGPVTASGTLNFDLNLSHANTWAATQTFGTMVVASAAPAAANSTGVAGTVTWANGFLYICVATNTWQRVAIATWP